MYDEILVPVDGSDGADAAVEHAADIARQFDAKIHVLNVADTTRDSVTVVGTEVVDALEREGENVTDAVASDLSDAGVEYETVVVQGDPAPTIAEYAESRGIDLVVMPTRGRSGLSRYLLGSVTEKVVRLSSVPVLTVRMGEDRPAFPYENVVMATDGSKSAERATNFAASLTRELDGTLHVVSVADTSSLGIDVRSAVSDEQIRETAETAVSESAETARDAGLESVVERVERGKPAKELLDYVEDEGADLVVMGATGKRDVDRILVGSVTQKLLRSSPVPVVTVR
ncbi:universal stress protein [Halorussus halophilus]|uniref:universal stress protein n=1 Tax=Halorussus halophilus TaxID=2650975 RepID=UPI00130173E5|nr:universal stress protein [Halorussus halophilus]